MNGSELIFDCGWRKMIKIHFQQNLVDIALVFDAFDGEEITDEQHQAYQLFLEKQADYEQLINQLLVQYISDNKVTEQMVQAKTLFIKRNGDFGILCDCGWDIENGIVIVLSPKVEILIQDMFI